jgi:hypothetical protein
MMLGKSLVLWFSLIGSQSSAFTPISTYNRRARSTLFMGKGLNKAKNSQADLAKKMALAKQQRDGADLSKPVNLEEPATGRLSDEEIKKRNDMLRFEQLLKAGGSVMNDFSGDNYLTKEQEEAEITAIRAGANLLFVGDPAPTQCFEELVSIKSENSIGEGGASRLVPWLRRNELRRDEYLIIVSDPRMKSPELRETMKSLMVELPGEILSRLIVVNADSPSENRRWVKQYGEIDVYSDEKMEWMQAYTALGDKRWSMSVFVVADERIQKLAREVNAVLAPQTIKSMVKSLKV